MTQTLFVAQGGSNTTSDLYTVDPATGVTTSVGPIGFSLTGLAQNPVSGNVYGITNRNSAAHSMSLISVNLSTGAGTFIGATASGRDPITDIAFDSAGNLFGQGQNGRLVSIDTTTGVGTVIGTGSGTFTFGGGLSFNSSDVLYSAVAGIYVNTDGGFRPLYTVNTGTGAYTSVATFSGGPSGALHDYLASAASFNGSGVLYVSVLTGDPSWWLCTINTSTGVVSSGVEFDRSNIDAIVWATVGHSFDISISPSTLTMYQSSSRHVTLTSTESGPSAQIVGSGTGGVATVTKRVPAGSQVFAFYAMYCTNQSGGLNDVGTGGTVDSQGHTWSPAAPLGMNPLDESTGSGPYHTVGRGAAYRQISADLLVGDTVTVTPDAGPIVLENLVTLYVVEPGYTNFGLDHTTANGQGYPSSSPNSALDFAGAYEAPAADYVHHSTSGAALTAAVGYLGGGWIPNQGTLIDTQAGTFVSLYLSIIRDLPQGAAFNPGAVISASPCCAGYTLLSRTSTAHDLTLSASPPAGITVTFSPSSISYTGTSTLTVATSATIAAGVYSFPISATDGTDTHSRTLTVTVLARVPANLFDGAPNYRPALGVDPPAPPYAPPYRKVILATGGLVLYWKLDELGLATSAVDTSGNHQTGTYGGVHQTRPTLGVAALADGTAASFNGTSNSVEIGVGAGPQLSGLTGFGQMSAEFWMKSTQTTALDGGSSLDTAYVGIVVADDSSSGGRFFLTLMHLSTGKLYYALFGTDATGHDMNGATVVNDGLRHHVVCTFDGTTMKIYVDGALDASTVPSMGGFPLADHLHNLVVGSGAWEAGPFVLHSHFRGVVDEFALYTIALTPTQIAAHHTAGL